MSHQAPHGQKAATTEGPTVDQTPPSEPKRRIVLQPDVEGWEDKSDEDRDAEAGKLYEAVIAALGEQSQTR